MSAEKTIGYRASPRQRALWRATRPSHRSTVRGVVSIEGDLDVTRLQESVLATIAAHEVLRTHLQSSPDGLLQIVSARASLEWRLESSGPRQHRLTIEAPAGCADARSLEILFREIANRHAGVAIDPVTLQYADISAWLNESASMQGEGRDFWVKVLGESNPQVHLPRARAESSEANPADVASSQRLLPQGAGIGRDLAARARVSMQAVLLGCWQALLARLARETRLPVVVTLDGRANEQLSLAVGPLENPIPIAGQVLAEDTIGSLLKRAQRQLDDASGWQQHFSWELASRDPSPTFGFSYHETAAAWTVGELDWQLQVLDQPLAAADVSLHCASSANALSCSLQYSASSLDAASVDALLRQFATMLGQFSAATLDTPVSRLDITGEDERHVLETVQRGASLACTGSTVLDLFDRAVAERPQNIAVSSGDAHLTYAELDARVNRLAQHLVAAGAGPDQVVGVCLDRDIPLVVSLLAIWKASAAYLPLNDIPESRSSYQLKNSGARIVVTEAAHASRFDEAGVTVVALDADWARIASRSATAPERRVEGANLAYVIYTSGSTGEPKGVMVEHRSLLNHMQWALNAFGLGERERMLMKTSISFDASVWEWQFPLLQGGTLVLLKDGMQRDPAYLVGELRDRRITTLQMVPTMLRVMLDEPALAQCESLERIFVGGEALDDALVARFRERIACPLINLYGPTEATIDATSLIVESHAGRAIGRPVANTRVRVLRADFSLAAIGEVGEIGIAGVALARGYIGRADATALKFVPDAYDGDGGRLYLTGDLGRYRADGVLEYLGREDGQVKIRGYRIEIGEIERALLAQPGVLNAAVVVKVRSPSERALVGFVELSPGCGTGALDAIRTGLRAVLPEHMCPALLGRVDGFPRTAGGKIDRRALAEREPEATDSPKAAACNETQARLVEIWSGALGGVAVGVHDNFFELGGDSIIGIQIVARARKAGLALTPLQLFQHQTIAELAAVADKTSAVAAPDALQESGSFPLTPIQHAFFEKASEDVNHYNQALLFVVPDELRVDLLERALAAVYACHDAFRLRFEQTPGGWRQHYATAQSEPFRLIRSDLSQSADEHVALQELIAQQHATLNIKQGPVLKAAVVHLGPSRGNRLLLVAHHLIVDGVSWRIILEDLAEAYRQLSEGRAAQLAARTTSYRRWSELLSKHALSESVQGELPYWRAEQQRYVETLHVDDATGENTTRCERRQVAALDEAATRQLLASAGKAYRTQFMDLFLSALADALHRWRNHSLTRIELEGHGREEIAPGVDLTRTVGWFTSLYPVVLERRDGEALGARIRRIKEQLRSVPNKGIGHGVLRHLGNAKDLRAAAALTVNYLGQLDGAVGRSAWLSGAPERCGDSASPTRERNNFLELNVMVVNGCLRMLWTYSGRCYRDETVECLARELENSLREVVAHCLSPTAGGISSSDLADFNWGTAQLDRLAAAIAREA